MHIQDWEIQHIAADIIRDSINHASDEMFDPRAALAAVRIFLRTPVGNGEHKAALKLFKALTSYLGVAEETGSRRWKSRRERVKDAYYEFDGLRTHSDLSFENYVEAAKPRRRRSAVDKF